MLIAYEVALEMVRELRPIVAALKSLDSNLADQLQRCATSVVLNLGEGQRRQKGNKHRAYETAHGEAREVLACLDCAHAWGWIAEDSRARGTCNRLLALCWGLTHSRHERASAA
jgi:four helix bundle protein